MEATYQITPEMLGLTWRRILRHAMKTCLLFVGIWWLLALVFHRPVLSGAVVGGLGGVLLSVLLMRPFSRTQLRVTNDSIETSDGPVIRHDAIARINEYNDGEFRGIEIVASAKPRWLRKYSIFIPAALPEYPQIRQLIERWVPVQTWHMAG